MELADSAATGAPLLVTSRARLIAHLSAQISDDGAVRDRCASRVLESALLLALLRSTRLHPARQGQLVRYLQQHPAPAGSLDRLLINVVLRLSDHRDPRRALEWLDTFDHFTAPRKRLMFAAVLAALGAVPADQNSGTGPISYTGLASWGELTMCAIKLLYQDTPDGHDVDFLIGHLATGSSKPIWEGHVLAHLFALTTLSRIAPRHPLLHEGIASLLGCQNPDGGIPFIDGFEIFCTVTAGLALIRATPSSPTLALMGDYLAAQQNSDGGWAYAEHVRQSDVDDTAYCLQFLNALNPDRYNQQITKGEQYLLAIANPDGGFPTFRHGHPSEAAMTAGALSALIPRWRHHSDTAQAALQYLLAAQQRNGTFESSWSLSEANAIYRALRAIHHSRDHRPPASQFRARQVIALATCRLRTTQHPDGGWGHTPSHPSDPISTSYSLLAAPHRSSSHLHWAAIAYLLRQQQSDGGITSPPDQAAPRPLPYDVPVLADICVLTALCPGPSQLLPGMEAETSQHSNGSGRWWSNRGGLESPSRPSSSPRSW